MIKNDNDKEIIDDQLFERILDEFMIYLPILKRPEIAWRGHSFTHNFYNYKFYFIRSISHDYLSIDQVSSISGEKDRKVFIEKQAPFRVDKEFLIEFILALKDKWQLS